MVQLKKLNNKESLTEGCLLWYDHTNIIHNDKHMLIRKCDICNKEIRDRETEITAGAGRWGSTFQMCAPCDKPVHDFLMKKKLISAEKSTGKKLARFM